MSKTISKLHALILAIVFVIVACTLWYETKFYSPARFPHSGAFGSGDVVMPELKNYGVLPEFSLMESRGKPFTKSSILGKTWIANFIYAQCSGPCPMLTEKMAKLRASLPSQIHFASFSVDPKNDTPQKLQDFAAMHDVKTDSRWVFITGDKTKMYNLIRSGFTLAVADNAKKEYGAKDDILHTTRFALIDKNGNVRGYYNGTDENELKQLTYDVKKLTKQLDKESL